MGEILSNLGIDWRLFVAQLINFSVLLFVLYRLLYKPLTGFLQKRAKHIQEGLEHAKEADKKLEEAEDLKEQKITEGRQEAQKIIQEAKASAEEQKQKIIQEGENKANHIIEEAKKEAEHEKQKMRRELEQQTGRLALQMAKTALQNSVTAPVSTDKLQQALKKLRPDS